MYIITLINYLRVLQVLSLGVWDQRTTPPPQVATPLPHYVTLVYAIHP